MEIIGDFSFLRVIRRYFVFMPPCWLHPSLYKEFTDFCYFWFLSWHGNLYNIIFQNPPFIPSEKILSYLFNLFVVWCVFWFYPTSDKFIVDFFCSPSRSALDHLFHQFPWLPSGIQKGDVFEIFCFNSTWGIQIKHIHLGIIWSN